MSAAALLAPAHPGHTVEAPFGPAQEIVTGQNGPEALAVGDIDRDGDPDLVTISSHDGLIVWATNDGSGGFSGAQTVTLSAEGGSALELADLDGDGDLDLIDQEEADGETVWWAFDSPLGLFQPGGTTLHASEAADRALAAGDADGDGDVDLYAGDSEIVWLEANGDGTFQPAIPVASGLLQIGHLSLADLDRDGDPDLLAALPTANRLVWFENDGTGLLGTLVTIGGVAAAGDPAVGDLDGDGDLDVVVPATGGDAVVWFENTGSPATPGWPSDTIDATAPGARAAAVADLDRDGDLDVAAAWEAGDAVIWYENLLLGEQWAEHVVDPLADGARTVRAVDANRDGDLDLVALHSAANRVVWYENLTLHRSAAGHAPHLVQVPQQPTALSLGDLDGDADLDLLLATAANADSLLWLENNGAPSLGQWTTHPVGSAFFPTAVLAVDIDGDSDLDGFLLTGDDEVWWRRNDGSPAVGTWTSHLVDSGTALQPVAMTAGDFDRDGDLDLATSSVGDNEIHWFENPGAPATGIWPAHTVDSASVENPGAIASGDVDLDGDLDLLVASRNNDSLLWFENDGSPGAGTWPAHLAQASAGSSPVGVAAGDVDGDGDLDAMIVRTGLSAYVVEWLENDGSPATGTWPAHLMAMEPVLTGSIAAGDADGDGDLDATVASSSGDRILTLENDGSPAAGPWAVHEVDAGAATSARGLVLGDVDGDGDLDPLGLSIGSDTVHWFENRGGQFAEEVVGTAPPSLGQASATDLVRSTLHHRGRSGDGDLELATVWVRLRDGLGGEPLSAAAAGSVLASVSVWKDADGDGLFDPGADLELATRNEFSGISMAGALRIEVPDDHPETAVPFGGPSLTFFLVAETTAGAAAAGIESLEVTYRPGGYAVELPTAEHRDFDLPAAAEYAPEAVVAIHVGPIFADGFESGDLVAWSTSAP